MKKYIEIENDIVQSIKDGKLKPNEQISSENELAARYNVSRMTARSAIIGAVNRGYLYTISGKGTFVKEPSKLIEIDVLDTRGFAERMASIHRTASTTVDQICFKKAYGNLIKLFDCTAEDECLFFERTRNLDGMPVIIEISYINPKYKNDLSIQDIVTSVDASLLEKHIERGKIRKELLPVIPNEEIRRKISLKTEMPILRVDHYNYLKNGDLFEYSKIFYNTSIFQFVSNPDASFQ